MEVETLKRSRRVLDASRMSNVVLLTFVDLAEWKHEMDVHGPRRARVRPVGGV